MWTVLCIKQRSTLSHNCALFIRCSGYLHHALDSMQGAPRLMQITVTDKHLQMCFSTDSNVVLLAAPALPLHIGTPP